MPLEYGDLTISRPHKIDRRVLDKNDEADPMIFAARQGNATQRISIRLCNIRYSAEPVIASRSADANGMPVAGSGAVPGGYSGGQVAKYFLGEGNCRSSASRCRSVPAVLGTSASKLMEALGWTGLASIVQGS